MQTDMYLSPFSLAGVGAGIAFVAVCLYRTQASSNLDHIPTVGLSGLWGSIRFLTHSLEIVQEGYNKHKPGVFKVADLTHRWTVVLSRFHLNDVAKALETELSFTDAINEVRDFVLAPFSAEIGFMHVYVVRTVILRFAPTHWCWKNLQVEYTLTPAVFHDRYHTPVLRSQLARNMGAIYPDIRNELVVAFDEALDLKGNVDQTAELPEWKSITGVDMIQEVMFRISNRVFVGLPLCRDPDWIALNIRLIVALIKEGALLRWLPKFIKPLAARWITRRTERTNRAARLLETIVWDRQRHMNEYGKEWNDKPNDMLQWCMDEGKEDTVDQLAARIMGVNSAAMQTTSDGFAQALFLLATDPQYAEMLREEVEMVVKEHGWTKEALTHMRKTDSFLKEVQRFQGPAVLGLPRKALRDMRLSDGTMIPKGTVVSFPMYAIHHDQDIYEDPDVFDPLRFVRLEDTRQDPDSRFQLVSVSRESLTFGLGKMACPGKYLAAVVMKSMLAHVVMEYDVKLDEGRSSGQLGICFGIHIGPDPAVRIMFRKRGG
ncbi:cytochrome P450 [Pisolithus marmoratus]|nr:cytochrome P450 [Pisolithus marmoratus]